MVRKSDDLGLQITPPEKECSVPICPFHGQLAVRGSLFEGTVVRSRMQGSVVVSRQRLQYDDKYQRYSRRSSRMRVHAPPCLEVAEGDVVRVGECRPLSKTVSFVVLERRGSQ